MLKKIFSHSCIFFILFISSNYRMCSQKDSISYYNKLHLSLKDNLLPYKETWQNLNRCITFFSKTKDSISLGESLIELSNYESRKGKYNTSFKTLWKALTIAENKQDIGLLYSANNQLSHLYTAFNKKEEAFKYQKKTLEFAKKGVNQGLLHKNAIVSAFFNIVDFYGKNNQIEKAEIYLDSCFYYAKKLNFTYDEKIYLFSEKGNIKLRKGEIEEAISIMEESKKKFLHLNPSYLTIIYFRLGNAYKSDNNFLIAKDYYYQALANLKKISNHYDFKPKILFQLSKTLYKLNDYKEAYKVLEQYKELNEHLFSPKSEQNKELLFIPNLHEEELKKKDSLIKQRDIELLQQKETINQFKIFLITIISILVIILLFFYLNKQRKKLKLEKEKQLLQKQKNNVLIELKNKELTSSTLQLIDKGNFINEIIEDINKYASDNNNLMKIIKQKTTANNNLWDQFDKQFTEVNKDFYKKLQQKFPNLSPTDLKHCALIKLNFSAKEMAQLLNITLNGVNTSRYRIRKKLNLQREDNLVNFMASI